MDALFAQISRLLAEDKPFALGTVIHTAGSTPQKAGARAIFLENGEILGTLGGGCMEAEARRRGLQMVHGGTPELMELHLDDDFGWDDGLICGGVAQIFLQPRDGAHAEVFEAVRSLHDNRERGVLCLIAKADDSAAVGEICLLKEGGEVVRPVRRSSGLSDGALAAAAEALLSEGREEPRRVLLKDPAATLYLEPLLPKPVCFIAGAGHIGASLCHYAARAGFEVAIVDDRASLCNAERLPDAAHVLVGDIVKTVREWPKTRESYFVIVTRGHKHDAVVLKELVNADVAYLGMIGSKRKILTIYDEFLEEGLATREELMRIHAPIGLDIGALTVEEIAQCIAAELIMVRRRGRGEGAAASNGKRYRDCAGGRRVAEDGDAQAALALREQQRAADGRQLVESLPRGPRAGRPGAS